MDITSIIIVSLIVSAFLLFAGVLAYGEYCHPAGTASAGQARRDAEGASRIAVVEHRDAA